MQAGQRPVVAELYVVVPAATLCDVRACVHTYIRMCMHTCIICIHCSVHTGKQTGRQTHRHTGIQAPVLSLQAGVWVERVISIGWTRTISCHHPPSSSLFCFWCWKTWQSCPLAWLGHVEDPLRRSRHERACRCSSARDCVLHQFGCRDLPPWSLLLKV